MDPIQDEARMRRVNVTGTRNVFECAEEAGVGRIVYLSSGVAYGAHSDNDFPLTEDSPLRANDDFNYAAMKGEVEAWLWPWAAQHPSVEVTVLRPSIILGPGVRNFITRQFEMPKLVSVSGHRPPWQFVHVDDVVAAIQHAIDEDLSGAFNVAPEGWLSADEVEGILGRSTLAIPEEVAFAVAEQMWKAGIGEAPAGQVNYLMHPWVMSIDKLLGTGFRFRHSNRDTLGAFAEEIRPYVTLGPIRAKRTTVAGVGLAGGALAAGLIVAGVRSLRSRRERKDGDG
jgi:nucleoside-diphosphate-sugar epimerase